MAQAQLVFYDPDANQANILAISAQFGAFFSSIGCNIKFRAAQREQVFEELIHDPETHFAIVPASKMHHSAGPKLTPLLVPSMQGDTYYRKLLVVSINASVEHFTGRSVAVTDPRENATDDSSEALRQLTELGIHNTAILPVPKDIDALLALYFGQVDGALVTPTSVAILKEVNPAAAQSYRVLGETRKILRAPLCALSGRASAAEQNMLVTALEAMGNSKNGAEIMRLLEFDGWQPFTAEMSSK